MSQQNTVRIISGLWRGRKIRFPKVKGIRPTPDRVRETVFNWLQGYIAQSKCLDCFAGSGVLGLEALSRGANYLVWIEKNPIAVKALKSHCQILDLDKSKAKIVEANALKFLDQIARDQFDLIFLDPPFSEKYIFKCLEKLSNNQWLSEEGLVYIEFSSQTNILSIVPKNFVILKNNKIGEVGYALLQLNKTK